MALRQLQSFQPRWLQRAAIHAGPSAVSKTDRSDRWVALLLHQKLKAAARGKQVARTSDADHDGMVDLRLAGLGDPKAPDEVFARLRWGGLFACVDPNPQYVGKLLQQYDNANGFVIEQGFDEIWGGPLGLRIPGVTPRAYFFVARKTHLDPPQQASYRFTYDVQLVRDASQPSGYCVRKTVPSVDRLTARLQLKFPKLDPEVTRHRAERLVHEVFPIFLTREAKIIDTLQHTLPERFRGRVPRPLRIGKNKAGFVTRLDMDWLRNAGPALSQLEFARQAAELLSVLHDHAKIMHLDLRPDNMVICEHGVGFIDFGSAAQIGEDLKTRPAIRELFDQLAKTNQVQRVLARMLKDGQITNQSLTAVSGKADPSVDTFYLAVQINAPHGNPELQRLIEVNPLGKTARDLGNLTGAVLRPINPKLGEFKSAADLLRGIRRIEARLGE